MAGKKRIDPPVRSADGSRPFDAIRNADPTRHYVFVNPNDEMTGVSVYESMGYEVVKKTADGPSAVIGKTASDGEVVTVLGQVLMSCPREIRDEHVRYSDQMTATYENRISKHGADEIGRRHGEPGRWGAEVRVDRNADGTPTTQLGK